MEDASEYKPTALSSSLYKFRKAQQQRQIDLSKSKEEDYTANQLSNSGSEQDDQELQRKF